MPQIYGIVVFILKQGMKKFTFILFAILLTVSSFAQTFKKNVVTIKTDIYQVEYSQVLEQPLKVNYTVQCPIGTAPRKGMDFYVNDSVKTSDNKDYENNVWDKGHMAPAADFNCTKEMLYRTFSYLNCALQHQDLNRQVWRLLEAHERELAKTKKVKIEIVCVFSNTSLRLPTGATVPDAFKKTIWVDNVVYGVYYFENKKPSTNDFTKYRIK
jgi:endonuclease G